MARATVAIPTYNRPDYLADCLASVAEQTFRDFDVVVLDNASHAGYRPVIERFSAAMDLEYVRNPENIGAGGNHAKAREIASRSEFALIFHDDDLMHPRMLEWQVAALDARPDVAWVAAEDHAFEDGVAPPTGIWADAQYEVAYFEQPTGLVRALLDGTRLNFGSTMFRSSLTADAAYRLEEFETVADRVFLVDAADGHATALLTQPLVLYRHHQGQDTHNPVFRERHALALMRYYRSLLPEHLAEADRDRLVTHSTNYLLHAHSMVPPTERQKLRTLTRTARDEGLFRWRRIRGQGVAALARDAGLGRAFEAIRPLLSRLRQLLSPSR